MATTADTESTHRGKPILDATRVAQAIHKPTDPDWQAQQTGIRFTGEPLGRPRKATQANQAELKQRKKQRQEDYRPGIPIDGQSGQGKHGCRLGYIRAKRADTVVAWVNSIFLVMNPMVLFKVYRMRWKRVVLTALSCVRRFHRPRWTRQANYTVLSALNG